MVALYRNGSEWMVRFENGLRFRRPRAEFVPDGQFPGLSLSRLMSVSTSRRRPCRNSQLEARQLIESLRLGIAPAQHVAELTINFEPNEKASSGR